MVWFALLACQEPFGFDRHDLRGRRIAALTVDVEADQVRPRAVLVVDGQLWADRDIAMDWAWVDAAGDSVDFPDPVASGPTPVLALRDQRLALRVRIDDDTLFAEIDPVDQRRAAYTLTLQDLQRPLVELSPDDLPLESRRTWTGTAARTLPNGGMGRFTLDAPDEARGRFMATGEGTFFELDARTTDWAAGTVTFTSDEITEATPLDDLRFTVLGLVLGAANGVAVRDVFVGQAPVGSWTQGRFVGGGLDVPYSATLRRDDDAALGFVATAVVPGDDGTTGVPDCMQETLDLMALLDHRCLRDDLDGQRVFLEPDA